MEDKDREKIYSQRVKAGKRTYFFDIKATRSEDFFLTITESKKRFNDDGTFEVLGKGTITIIDPGKLTRTNYLDSSQTSPLSLHNLTVHLLSQGDQYDYQTRTVVPT